MSATELIGDTWFGTGGRRLNLGDFGGKFLLLDFWTLCCVNCHHVLDELRPIEQEFADILTVVGVHSPKFEFEKNPKSVLSAIHRHGINHPVLNDPNMATWRAYGVRAWPTLVLVDPAGNVAQSWSGEGHGHAIRAKLRELASEFEAAGLMCRGESPFFAEAFEATNYLQPGKIESLGPDRVIVSDSGHHSLALAEIEHPNSPVERIGIGQRGFVDGDYSTAQFNEPYGCALVPEDLAQIVGYHVVVADTVNHALRGINLEKKIVHTIAGTGDQWRPGQPTEGEALSTSLSTPWDVAFVGGICYVAMAGDHRLWVFDPVAKTVHVAAGTTHEGLVDGPASQAWFAQPSGLCAAADGLWILDSETSAVRIFDGTAITTHIGTGLFEFGHIDGSAAESRLQHPLGLDRHPDGSLYIADCYNGAIRRYDPSTSLVTTVAQGLGEPSDVCVMRDGQSLLVVEAANGIVSRIPLENSETVQGPSLQTMRPELEIAAGSIVVNVTFMPPQGQNRDDRFGPSTQMTVSASPPDLILEGSGTDQELTRTVLINSEIAGGVLHVAARGASCDGDTDHAACHMHQQDWGVPIRVVADGSRRVDLILAGSVAQ